MSERFEAELHSDQEWIQVYPYGVTLAADQSRPIMIFKDEQEKLTLPVWLSPVDAGISLTQAMNRTTPSTPHSLTQKMLGQVGVALKKCLFVDIKGHHQIVQLHFEGHPKLKVITHRADESLSFCLHAKAEFFAQRWFFDQSRQLNAELEGVQKGLELEPGLGHNEHPYVM
ncbi:MAG: bifunctional nuclease family protein [Bdellovibrionaceae bacterium]|nr:bifunctional nuclease family protein [Bdellovibrionales bacterium]MCB9083656.1 bifunctional nuclease family protein [Pseudobdellovibrionaceae bacterium]